MKGGTVRRIANTFRGLVGLPTKNKFADPVLREPRERRKKRSGGRTGRKGDVRPMIKRGGIKPAGGRPGTIGYHDKLVRHFGRRQANKYGRCIIAKQLDLLPTAEDFAASPPWAHLSTGTG